MNEIKLNKEQINIIEKIYEENKYSYKDIPELISIIFSDEKAQKYFLSNQIDELNKELEKIWEEMYMK